MSGSCKKETGKIVQIIIIDKIMKLQCKEAVHKTEWYFCGSWGHHSHHGAANKG